MTTLPLDPYIATGGYFHNPTSPGENAYHEPPVMRSFASAIRLEIGTTVPPPPDLSNFYTKAESDARFVNITGDTMTGDLTASNFITPGFLRIGTSGDTTLERLTTGFLQVNGKMLVDTIEGDGRYAAFLHNHDGSYLPIGTHIPPDTHIISTNGSVAIVESPVGTFDLAATGAGGSVTVLRDEEFAPAAAATTVVLAGAPTDIHSVTRNGVTQSQSAGHYSVAGSTITFTDAFVAGERVTVIYAIGTSVPVDTFTKAEADARFVNVSGDTMTGKLWATDVDINTALTFANDVTAKLSRTGAGALRVDNWLSVGGSPPAAAAAERFLQVGAGAFLKGQTASWSAILVNNSYWDGTALKAVGNAGAASVTMDNGAVSVGTAPSVAAGAAQTFTTRFSVAQDGSTTIDAASSSNPLRISRASPPGTSTHWIELMRGTPQWLIGSWAGESLAFMSTTGSWLPRFQLAQTGTLTLTPDAGQAALAVGGAITTTGGSLLLQSVGGGAQIGVDPITNTFIPWRDSAIFCGSSGQRWSSVWAVNPTIQTSHVTMKRDFARLDGAACTQAVLDTDWLSFRYINPAEPERSDGTDDEAWLQQQDGYQKLLADTAVSRQQKGYVLGSDTYKTADLFGQADRYSASTHADLAVVACALQQALKDIADLKALIAGGAGA